MAVGVLAAERISVQAFGKKRRYTRATCPIGSLRPIAAVAVNNPVTCCAARALHTERRLQAEHVYVPAHCAASDPASRSVHEKEFRSPRRKGRIRFRRLVVCFASS